MAQALEPDVRIEPPTGPPSAAAPTRRRRWRVAAPLVAVVAIALACAACFPPPSPGSVAGDTLTAMNQDRAASGLGGLAWDSSLAGIAQSHAQAMADSGSLWHSDLGWLIAQPSMAGTWTMGENLLMAGGTNGYAAEDLWMASPPHRANILNGAFNRVGIGVVTDGGGRTWMVALFGAR
jgi:uncharacterized protein YkwD